MHPKFAAVLLATAAAPVFAADPPPPPFNLNAPLPTPTMSAEECAVWNRERSFARSVEAHDAAAFKRHLHPGAVFFGGPDDKLVGAEQVTQGWAGIIEDGPRSLRWYPRRVAIAPGTEVAHSVGFYWMEDRTPGSKRPFALGEFNSIWTKVDGQWMVTFDGGGGGVPRPATKEEVDAVKASLAPECPQA